MLNKFSIPSPYLLFTGEADDAQISGKTAAGIAYWAEKKCLGQLWLKDTRLDLGLPHLSLKKAVKQGARTLIIGVAPLGGKLDKGWIHLLNQALKEGLHLASGLHVRLGEIPKLRETAEEYNRKLFDVRYFDGPIPSPTAKKRRGMRLLTVGTDCTVGKMYASLAITKAMKEQGIDATFRATGQTGIFIAGSGMPLDNLPADFFVGAVEMLTPNAPKDHWDIIEGQGAFFHPQSAGGTMLLIHGSQPDVMVLCHNTARKAMAHFPDYKMPDLSEYIRTYEEAARLTNSHAKIEGISLNTSQLKDKKKALKLIKTYERKYHLPCFDPVLTGVDPFIDHLMKKYKGRI